MDHNFSSLWADPTEGSLDGHGSNSGYPSVALVLIITPCPGRAWQQQCLSKGFFVTQAIHDDARDRCGVIDALPKAFFEISTQLLSGAQVVIFLTAIHNIDEKPITMVNLSNLRTILTAAALIAAGAALTQTAHAAAAPVEGLTRLDIVAASASDYLARRARFPENAIDGDPLTRWSARGMPQWFMADLGAAQSVSQLRMKMDVTNNGINANYDVDVSLDNELWSSVLKNATPVNEAGWVNASLTPVKARYIRIRLNSSIATDYTGLYEFEVYGQALPADSSTSLSSSGDEATSSSALLYFTGVGNGYQFTAPADATQRTLRIYLGGWRSRSKVEAFLSDNSAPAYVAILDEPNGTIDRLVTLIYSAAGSGQTLTIRHTLLDDYGMSGNIVLQAATLQASAEVTSALLRGKLTAAPTIVDLTTEGTADWASWGLIEAPSFTHMDGDTPLISNITPIGIMPERYDGKRITHSWTNGVTAQSPEQIENVILTLTWKPNPGSVDGYIVYFGPNVDAINNETTDIKAFSGSFDPASPLIQYDSWFDLGLAPGDPACFKLRAYNADGISDWSSPVCSVIPQST